MRVRIWRKLQQLGAVPIKNSIYVLPNTASTREDFEWLRKDIVQMRGDASIFYGNSLSPAENRELVEAFRAARAKDYAVFCKEAEAVRTKAGRLAFEAKTDRPGLLRLERRWSSLKAELERLKRVDFFGASNRGRAEALAQSVQDSLRRAKGEHDPASRPPKLDAAALRGRVWVTRLSPHVDRLVCAWLIRRFIDPKARLKFVAEPYAPAQRELRYDMTDGEFTHWADWCSFETLLYRVGLAEPALLAMAEIVHDIDLKDGKFGRLEAPGVALSVSGICRRFSRDHERVDAGRDYFDGLYEALRAEGSGAGP